MKYKQTKTTTFSFSPSKVCALCLAPVLFSIQALSTAQAAERWFEVEVILFSQLGDKSLLTESFPDLAVQPASLPKYRRTVDLLTPYVYPDTSALKLQLPQCGDYSTPKTFVELASVLPTFHKEKSLKQISQAQPLIGVEETELHEQNLETPTAQSTETQTLPSLNNAFTVDTITEEAPITAAQLALVAQADEAFNGLTFQYSNNIPFKQICALPTVLDDKFAYNLTGTIDANENVYSDKPYLISKDSLQLTDMYRQLKRSRNFKPLLHLGWRLAPKPRNKAAGFRIIAGENLAFNYEKSQLDYQTALLHESLENLDHPKSETLQEDVLNGGVGSSNHNNEQNTISTEELAEQLIQNKINEILATVDNISATDELHIIDQLDAKSLAIDTNDKQLPSAQIAPVEPAQPWTLDGLFRVHLNHYLYITADFNMLDTSSTVGSLNEKDETPKVKSIRFKQNRRVISGEIHYFDHPYMGMIVQIRKHARPEPEDASKSASQN